MTKRLSFILTLFVFLLAAPMALAAPADTSSTGQTEAATPVDAGSPAPTGTAEDETSTSTSETTGGSSETGEGSSETGDAAAPAGDEPTVEDLVFAVGAGEWAIAVSSIIMLLLGAARRFKLLDKVSSDKLPWVAVALGCAAAVGEALASGGAVTVGRVMTGVLAGAAASGLWSLIGKHLPIIGKAPDADSE